LSALRLAALQCAPHLAGSDKRWRRTGVSALHLLFLPTFGVALYNVGIKYDDRFAYGIPRGFSLVLMMPSLISLLTLIFAFILATRRAGKSLPTRQWVAISSSVVLLALYWNWRLFWIV